MKYLIINLPNLYNKNIHKGYAGGFGTLGHRSRKSLFPIYLLYAASAIENVGCIYKILDAQALRYNSSQVLDFVKKENADVLISWVSIISLHEDLTLLAKIKKENHRLCIVAIGTILNVMPEKGLLNSVDLVIKGVYPYYNHLLNMAQIFNSNSMDHKTFGMINGGIYVNDGKIIYNHHKPLKENLDELSTRIYNLLPIEKYIDSFEDINGRDIRCFPIVTSVGCPYECFYCPYPIGYGKEIINKSVENIINEIQFLKNNFDINGFIFRDQLFTHNLERVTKLCDEIIKKNLGIKWFVEARADRVSKELLLKMKEAGCFRIHYGVETGDAEILKKIGKPGLNIETFKKTFEITKGANILIQSHLIVGLPGETNLTLKKSLKLLYLLNPDDVNISIITPYPGTKLFELAKEKGWIIDFNLEDYTGFNAVMRTDDLSIKKLNFARQEMLFKFTFFKLIKDKNYRKKFIRHLPRLYKNLFELCKRIYR